MDADKRLEILHDHYKETFARVLAVEKERERLFLIVIGLYALLSLEIGYPAAIGGALEKVSLLGTEISLKDLPLPALLNATWVLTLAISLRYCRTSVWVNRHYPYVHHLEEVISPGLGGGDIYRREGKVYLQDYPPILNVAWFAYAYFFPILVIAATGGLLIWEYRQLTYAWPHRLLDGAVGITLITLFFIYRVQPSMAAQWKTLREWWARRHASKQASPQTPTTPAE